MSISSTPRADPSLTDCLEPLGGMRWKAHASILRNFRCDEQVLRAFYQLGIRPKPRQIERELCTVS